MHLHKIISASLVAVMVVWTTAAPAYEEAYSQAGINEVEVLVLPESKWVATESEGRYFEKSDLLFRRLFNYIYERDIAMTVPVEARLDKAQMRFFLGTNVAPQENDKLVRVVSTGSRTVARLGGEGSYSEKNIAPVRVRLEQWINANPEWQIEGPAYAVFWDGPFTLWFLKRFEVHVTIVSTTNS
jgi:hypothetical protein